MAQKQARKETQPPRRVVKKAEETVRQKTVKTAAAEAESAKKPGVLRLTLRYIGMPFRPVGRLLKKVGRLKPFRIIGHILLPRYFRNSWKELRQVTWPNRRESRQLTTAVIIFAALFGAMIAVVDYGLDKLFKQVLIK